ncbi:sulfurtransferase [Marisediminicola senii]|uniref:sulfurtransferase n=1 Tax=Marisediminicola senii TaxID=2711233 RepID=UPI0013EDCFE3|nr:rhodanese-like domain-containing protein [Marisediminicola senii]
MSGSSPARFVRPLVSTQWLADHLGADDIVVLDATVLEITGFDGEPAWITGDDAFLVDGHVPGAHFADLLEAFSDPAAPFGFARPTAGQFEAAASTLGIDNDSTVIVYDSSLGQWAARLWWLFRANGFDNVAVLDGGFTRWHSEERPIETGYRQPREATFVAQPREHVWADKGFVETVVRGERPAVLVCSLPRREFSGEVTVRRRRRGHIPGSINVPISSLVDPATTTFLEPPAIRRVLAPALAPASTVVAYCAGGITAAGTALALALIGHDDVVLYDGSLNEWAADPAAPLVTTA